MLSTAIVFSVLTIIGIVLEVLILTAEYGFLAFVIAAVIFIPAIIMNIVLISAMGRAERRVWIIVCNFIFGNIISGILYSVWYGVSGNNQAVLNRGQIDPTAAMIHWECSNCGKEVTFVHHCICGHDYVHGVDKDLKSVLVSNSAIESVYCPACGGINTKKDFFCTACGNTLEHKKAVSKKSCPCCGAILSVNETSCFNCGQEL